MSNSLEPSECKLLSEIAFPTSRVEQTFIAERLLAETEKTLVEETVLSKMLNLKAGLMNDLLTGRVRITPLLKKEDTDD